MSVTNVYYKSCQCRSTDYWVDDFFLNYEISFDNLKKRILSNLIPKTLLLYKHNVNYFHA